MTSITKVKVENSHSYLKSHVTNQLLTSISSTSLKSIIVYYHYKPLISAAILNIQRDADEMHKTIPMCLESLLQLRTMHFYR